MPKIVLETYINAPAERVFDLSRSINLHKLSTAQTNEEAISGVVTGLISMGEHVKWRARHFGIYQTLTSKITEFDRPRYFVDEMVQGVFHSFVHLHHFEEKNETTIMRDIFNYQSPLGFLGKIADVLFLKRYMTRLLKTRNELIKKFAETSRWKEVITD
ncbi:MAG: cell division protein [Bacteroidetes bacterium]|nr:MAG: cell division protein [Bacteroidota bacterium]